MLLSLSADRFQKVLEVTPGLRPAFELKVREQRAMWAHSLRRMAGQEPALVTGVGVGGFQVRDA